MNRLFVATNMDRKILTKDSENRKLLVSTDQLKLYGHRSKDVEHLPSRIKASSGEQNGHKELDVIFGPPANTSDNPNSIPVDEFVVETLSLCDPPKKTPFS